MEKKIAVIIFGAVLMLFSSCDVLKETADTVLSDSKTSTSLTNGEVVSGLKEALNVGIKNAVDITSVTNGFLNNAKIKLPFPKSAIAIKDKALEWGLDKQVDKIVTTLNRAAEDAVKTATPIFINAIKNMSIQDGFKILRGGEGSATSFLKEHTRNELIKAFAPKVAQSIEKVQLTKYWEPVAKKYNLAMNFTGGKQVNTDLNAYVTEKAIDGLFVMVEKEENKIRKDPGARVTDLLKKVFGSLTN